MNEKSWKIGCCVLVPIIILMFPAPEGLSLLAWRLFALYMGTICGLILRPFSEAVVLLVTIAASALAFRNTGSLLVGYASPTAWLVFSAFMIGAAFTTTGLGRRIAYILIGKFGKTSLRLGYVAVLTDLIISPATPSGTARSGGIVYPIFQSISVTLDSTPGETARRIGAYLVLAVYYASYTTGYLFITALAPNALMLSFATKILGVEVSWIGWAVAAAVPGGLMLLLIPWVLYKIYPPEIKEIDNVSLAQKGLVDLGPMTLHEKILCVLFILAILGWALGSYLKIDSAAVAISFVAASLLTGVIKWEKVLESKGAWSTLIWYGGIIGFADALAKANFFEWLGQMLAANIDFTGVNPYVIMASLMLCSLSVRYVFASLAAYVATIIPVFFTIVLVAKLPVLPSALLILFTSGLGGMLTHYAGALSPLLYGIGYVDIKTWWIISAIMALLSVTVIFSIGLPYWAIIGLW